jgi:hypothetical protein
VEWFQSIGNAVAGAIGVLLYSTLHYLNDTWVFLGWIFSTIGQVIAIFVLPFNFAIQFIRGVITTVFDAPPASSITWDPNVLAVFSAIPYWSTISIVLGACLSVLALVFILKQFTKL